MDVLLRHSVEPTELRSSHAPFPTINSREMGGALIHQFRPAEVLREQIDARRDADQRELDNAFALPTFVANRICPWCSKFCHEEHFLSCEKRLVTCPLCKEYVLATDAVTHYKDCEDKVVLIATERIVRRYEEQRRQDAENNERRRVQMLHAKAEADAAALRQRASSIVTKKQSIGNLLFSGVSIGNEAVETQSVIAGGIDGASESGGVDFASSTGVPKRSMVRIISDPEILRSNSISTAQSHQWPSGGEDTGSAHAGSTGRPSVTYNRQSSFFSRTNSIGGNSPLDQEAMLSTEGDRHSSVSHTVMQPRNSVTHVDPGTDGDVPTVYNTTNLGVPPPLPTAAERGAAPSSLPRRFSSAAHPVSHPTTRVVPVAPTVLPPPLPNAAIVAPPSRQSRSDFAVDSPTRAASVTSASPPGMKRCKWCGVQAAIEHERKCASRIVMCKKCNSMIKVKDKEEHVKICSSIQNNAGDEPFVS